MSRFARARAVAPTGQGTIRVTYFERKLAQSHKAFSIGNWFEAVRAGLPPGIEGSVVTCRFMSDGILRRLFDILRATFHQGDVNHVTGDVNYLTYLLRRDRTVWTNHDCVFEQHYVGIRRRIVRYLWLTLPARRAGVITANSEFTKEEMVGLLGCDPNRIIVVPMAIPSVFEPVSKAFDHERPTVLQVGTKSNKNLERTWAALSGMACRLRIIGQLSDEQRELCDSLGLVWSSVVDLSTDELVGEYSAADLVVFASTYEGFGMPVVEANAVGRPVVTSNVAAMPETAGDAACLVDPFDVDSIRSGIRRVIEDSAYRDQLIENGYRNRLRFTTEASSEGFAAIYRRITVSRI